MGSSTRADSQADDGRTSTWSGSCRRTCLRAWGLNGRHVDEGRATTRLGWSTTTHERVKGARIVPRGNAPKNAWWIGRTTKIVVARQKNAANVVGPATTESMGGIFFYVDLGALPGAASTIYSGADNKTSRRSIGELGMIDFG